MQVTEHALFPTRLLTIQFPDVDGLNEELFRILTTRDEFREGFDMHPDSLNLLKLAETCPAIARVRGMLLEGLKHWLAAERAHGEMIADVTLFCNFANRGDYTIVHNHSADVVGVYYVRTAATKKPALALPDPDGDYDYFDPEDGALILHDPRFNANLAAARSTDYAKVFPRPGLMLIFPAYLWHSVTPSQSDGRRLALSANFSLRAKEASNAESFPIRIENKSTTK
jgi:hypothetical protein